MKGDAGGSVGCGIGGGADAGCRKQAVCGKGGCEGVRERGDHMGIERGTNEQREDIKQGIAHTRCDLSVEASALLWAALLPADEGDTGGLMGHNQPHTKEDSLVVEGFAFF